MAATRRRTASAKKPVSAASHNRVLKKALARVDKLEGRLARVIQPILDDVGEQAAERFGRFATNHLSAAAANADVNAASMMVCVRPRPDEAAALADPEGDAPEMLHVTLVYLGQNDDDQAVANAVEALKSVAAQFAPLEGVVAGYGLFDPAGVGILLPDVRGLVELRVAVCEALLAAGIDYGRDHGFEAHISVHRDPTNEQQVAALKRAAGQPLHFDAICVVRGNAEEVELPLVGIPSLTADASQPPAWTSPFPDELLNITQLVNLILEKTNPVRRAMIEQTMTPALEQAGLSWSVTNPLTAATLASTASQVTGIAETTQLNLMRIIRSAYQNGLSIPQTRDLIREGMKVASKTRATMIARTELARAANGGSLAATRIVAGATGTQYEKRWETAAGAKYPRHEDYAGLDGQKAALDAAFTVGQDELQFPGDPNGSAEETINCRCAMTYHTPEGGVETADAETPPELDTADTAGGGGGGGQITLPSEALNAHLAPLTGTTPVTLASDLAARAKAIEPAITDTIKASAEANGAQLGGLEYRLKTADSAAEKIESDMVDRYQTARETAYEVNDMVRYTALYSPDQYVDGAQAMLTDLQNRGLHVVRFRNTWVPDAPYAGLNIQLAAANGFKFELQFHTPESFALKQGIQHKLYEEWRRLPLDDPRRAVLTNQMAELVAKLEVPTGVHGYDFADRAATEELGVTPFRPENDPIGFYDSDRYQQFVDQVYTTSNDYGVTVEGLDHMTGVWQGETEPSVAIRAHDHVDGLQAFAASLGRSYEQDGVLVFGRGGGDLAATFPSASQEDAFAALKNAGLDGGRFTTAGELQVLGQDTPEFREQLGKVAAELGRPKVETGSFMLFENGEYQGLLDKYDAGKPLALQSPEQGIANATSALDPGGQDIDAALSSIGQQVSIPGRYDASDPVPVIEAKVVGNITVGGVNADGMFSPNDMTIEVRRLSDRYPTFTHEFGHAVDHLTATGIEAYATDTIEAVGLSDWYEAIKETPTYKDIEKALSMNAGKETSPGDPLMVLGSGHGSIYYRGNLDYAVNPQELFARSFVQWLSLKDGRLATHVSEKLGLDKQSPGFWYWQDDEFTPVARALENWLQAKGLLVGR